jgi:ankyrin repeat protein
MDEHVNKPDSSGQTPLILAIKKGNIEVIEQLLNSNKVNINMPDCNGLTPLKHATDSNNMEIINLLNKAIMAQDCKLRLERFQTDPANQHLATSSSRLFGSKDEKPKTTDDSIDAIDQKVNEDHSDVIPNNPNP